VRSRFPSAELFCSKDLSFAFSYREAVFSHGEAALTLPKLCLGGAAFPVRSRSVQKIFLLLLAIAKPSLAMAKPSLARAEPCL
jgi:hypothetical protein